VDEIEQAARLLKEAKQVCALTGAGISVESGIPDFRSPDGLWARYDPIVYASLESFIRTPERFYEMARELNPTLENARPNPSHLALVELEKLGKCSAVITQNIDYLHQRAGSSEVLEVHGTYSSGHCLKCKRKYTLQEIIRLSEDNTRVPLCEDCEGVIKPDVVFFGESLDAEILGRASTIASTCDLMLVIGCSLEVYPAASLPIYTKRNQGKLIFFNTTRTIHDQLADIVCIGRAGDAIPALVEAYKKLLA
jgi:NAD-dependent deacetylase